MWRSSNRPQAIDIYLVEAAPDLPFGASCSRIAFGN